MWDHITDVANAPEWVAGARRTEHLPGPRNAAGEQWLQVDAYGPLVQAHIYEVAAWRPPVEHAFRSTTGPAVAVRHRLEPAEPQGTRVTFEMRFEPPVRLVTELVGPAASEALARRVLERSARALKARVEGRSRGGSPGRRRGGGAGVQEPREVVVSEIPDEDLPTAP